MICYRRYCVRLAALLCGGMLSTLVAVGSDYEPIVEGTARAIDRVVVTGTRSAADLRLLPMTVSVVDRSTFEQTHRSSLLPTLTEQVPGLFITGRSVMGYGVSTGAAGGMTLRGIGAGLQGGPTTALLVLIDGHPQYMGLMGHPIADAYQSMLVDRVEVVRGPATVLYGSNAMGGVVNIVTRKVPQDGVATDCRVGYGSYNTLQSEVSNSVQKGAFSSFVTASYNRSDGHRPNMGFEQYGGYVKLGYRFHKAWRGWADLNLTHFNASNPGTVFSPLIDNDSRITRGAASVVVENDYGWLNGALSGYLNWGAHNINDGYALGGSPLDYRFHSRDRMAGVSCYQTARLFRGNRTTVGIDWQHFGGKAWNHQFRTDENTTTADKTMDEVAAYIDFRQSLGTVLTLDAGLRIDHHSHVGTQGVPQGGLSLRLSPSASLKARVSKGFRFPTIREMYMFPPQNPDLRPERIVSYELFYGQQLCGGALRYEVSLFYIYGDNLIVREPVNGRPKYLNTGVVRSFGAEGELSYRFSDAWSVQANYSWLHMQHPVIASPEHKLYGGVRYEAGRWTLSTGVQYVRGLYTSTDPIEMQTFTLWNADVSCRVATHVELYLRGENLLAQRYQTLAGFPMPRATAMGGFHLRF